MQTLIWHGREYVLPERVNPLSVGRAHGASHDGYPMRLSGGVLFRKEEELDRIIRRQTGGVTNEEILRRLPVASGAKSGYDKGYAFLVVSEVCLHSFVAGFLLNPYLSIAGVSAERHRLEWMRSGQRLLPAETTTLMEALAAAAERWRDHPREALRRDVWHPAVIVRMYGRGIYPEGTPPERQFDTLLGEFNEMSASDQEELEVVVSTYVADFYARLVRRLTKWKTHCGDGFCVMCERED